MTFQDLFDKSQELIDTYSQPDKLIGSIVYLIILIAIFSIPFIGVPLGLVIFAITLLNLFKQ